MNTILLLSVIPMIVVAWWGPRFFWTYRYPGWFSTILMTIAVWPVALFASLAAVMIAYTRNRDLCRDFYPDYVRDYVPVRMETGWEFFGLNAVTVFIPCVVAFLSCVLYANRMAKGGETIGAQIARRTGFAVGRMQRMFGGRS